MRFDLDGLEVFFPYDRMYLEQYQYMRAIKQALEAEGHALLEMPTGTVRIILIASNASSASSASNASDDIFKMLLISYFSYFLVHNLFIKIKSG